MPTVDVVPNLPLSTLDFQKIASSYPESLAPQRAPRLLSETSQSTPLTLRTLVISAPFSTPTQSAPARRTQPSMTHESTPSIMLRALTPPFVPVLMLPSLMRRTPVDTSAASPYALLRQVIVAPFVPAPHITPMRRPLVFDTSRASPQVLLTTVVARPFSNPPHDTPMRRPIRGLEQQDNYLPLRTTVVARPFAQLDWPGPIEYRLHFQPALEVLLAPFYRGGSSPVTLPTDRQVLSHKLTNVDVTFTLDFISRLNSGESIASVTTMVSVWSGEDANPNALKSGSPTISRTRVRQLTTGGEAGVLYTLTAVVLTSAGRTLEMFGIFAVLDPDEVLT